MDGDSDKPPAAPDPAGVPPPAPPPAGETPVSPAPPAPALSRWQRRERAAADALRTFLRDLHEAHHGAVAPNTPEVTIELRLRLQPGAQWALAFEPSLEDQVLPQLVHLHSLIGVYREGRVYCYKCDSTACDHAAPPTPLSVFDGFDPMGLPEWKELTQVLVDTRDERVERLYGRPPRVVTLVRLGRELRARQLAEFGRASKSYSVLGQVAAGYFPCAGAGGGAAGGGRIALTFQIVETLGARGEVQLRLNTIASFPAGVEPAEWLVGDDAAGVGRARDAARFALQRLERAARAAASAEEMRRTLGAVPGILHRLAESIERGRRQDERRTRHVEQRRVEDRRPVHKAIDDLAMAGEGKIFRDEREATLIVCGDQGRAHVFSPTGRHITSFTLGPGGAEFRVRTGRWTPLQAADAEALRCAVRGASVVAEDETAMGPASAPSPA